MAKPIHQTVELGSQWPTLDPFLFCAHHLDKYPAADDRLAPAASLQGRNIGMDFAGVDGWNMYHGSTVPGFPQHPHRGFETVTYVRSGWCDHSDSLGAQARFGEGDVQWLTAGAGIVHSEMFPLFDQAGPNTLHLFQIWLNLPAADKMVSPYFSMLWREEIPKHTPSGSGVEVTMIAGELESIEAATPPPDSWAARPDSHVAIWHARFDPNAKWTLPAAPDGCSRVLYLFDGEGLGIGDESLANNHGAVLDPSIPIELHTAAATAECLILQGRPIGEPVAQQGPFVMNDEAGIRQAMVDYQETGYGGWPWSEPDPVHGIAAERFARHTNGRVEKR